MRRSAALALAAALAACAPPSTPTVQGGYVGTPPLGAPFTADELSDPGTTFTSTAMPGQAWHWIPFPDAWCADGSEAGLAVSPGDGADVVVILDGGGACWDYVSCTSGTAFDRAYGPAELATEVTDYFPRSLADRAFLPGPLATANLVFVPYCTADVHGGDRVATYTGWGGLDTTTWSHLGHANVMAFLRRIAATFPAPGRLLVAGSSAGGFGALADYEAFRWYYPDARGYLVDDSGPALVGNDLSADLRDSWFASWNLGASIDPFCGRDCRADLSAAYVALARLHRDDRIALLTYDNDAVMRVFLELPLEFPAAIGRLEAVLDATANARSFVDRGEGHMLLTSLTASTPSIETHETNGVTLSAWLEAMVGDDPAWGSVRP